MIAAFATVSYAIVPAWMALNIRRPHMSLLTVLLVALHLAVVAIRRPLFTRGFDDAAMWLQIHEVTMALAGCIVIYEIVYWLVWRQILHD